MGRGWGRDWRLAGRNACVAGLMNVEEAVVPACLLFPVVVWDIEKVQTQKRASLDDLLKKNLV